jgi:hypothetical protein
LGGKGSKSCLARRRVEGVYSASKYTRKAEQLDFYQPRQVGNTQLGH